MGTEELQNLTDRREMPYITLALIANVKECDLLRSNNQYNSYASFQRRLPFPKEGFFRFFYSLKGRPIGLP